MADAKSITFRPAVPSDAQVVAAIVNGAYRGDDVCVRAHGRAEGDTLGIGHWGHVRRNAV